MREIEHLYYLGKKDWEIRLALTKPDNPLNKDDPDQLPGQSLLESFTIIEAKFELLTQITETQATANQTRLRAIDYSNSQTRELLHMLKQVEKQLRNELTMIHFLQGQIEARFEKLEYKIRELEDKKPGLFRW